MRSKERLLDSKRNSFVNFKKEDSRQSRTREKSKSDEIVVVNIE